MLLSPAPAVPTPGPQATPAPPDMGAPPATTAPDLPAGLASRPTALDAGTTFLAAIEEGGGDLPALPDPTDEPDRSVEYEERAAATHLQMLDEARASFADYASEHNIPASVNPLFGSVFAASPSVSPDQPPMWIPVSRTGGVALPPRAAFSSVFARVDNRISGRPTSSSDLRMLQNAQAGRVQFTGLKPRSEQGRRNAADLKAISGQHAALEMCFDRLRDLIANGRRPAVTAAGISYMDRWRQFCYEVAHVGWIRWCWLKGHQMTWIERQQEDGLMALFASYMSKRHDTHNALLQAIGHVLTWKLVHLQLPAPPFPFTRKILSWAELRMSQEVPFRHQRNALEPRHVLGIRQYWLKLAERHHDKLEFNLAAYYVNLLFALLAGVSFGFRATEVCPGQLFFLRRASQDESDAMATTCTTSLYWDRGALEPLLRLPDGHAQCVAPMWRKTSGRGARAKQERLNQPVPFARQDTNPINFVSNYVALLLRFDPTPTSGDIKIPAFRDTRTTLSFDAPALSPQIFQQELVAATTTCFPSDAKQLTFGDAAMRMCACVSWYMAGATEADQRAMGTWTSAAFHLYNMAPLERMAFLSLQANATQFTTATALRRSSDLPMLTPAAIAATAIDATRARAVSNDFGLPDIFPANDDYDASNPMAGPIEDSMSLELHEQLCDNLARDATATPGLVLDRLDTILPDPAPEPSPPPTSPSPPTPNPIIATTRGTSRGRGRPRLTEAELTQRKQKLKANALAKQQAKAATAERIRTANKRRFEALLQNNARPSDTSQTKRAHT